MSVGRLLFIWFGNNNSKKCNKSYVALIAQLVRAFPWKGKGCKFDSYYGQTSDKH